MRRLLNLLSVVLALLVLAPLYSTVAAQGVGDIHITAEQGFALALSALGLYLLAVGKFTLENRRQLDRIMYLLEGSDERPGLCGEVAQLIVDHGTLRATVIDAAHGTVQEVLSSFEQRLADQNLRIDRALEERSRRRDETE